MTDLKKEYSRYLTTLERLKIIQREKAYESKNILERWYLNILNDGLDPWSPDPVLIKSIHTIKMIEEMKEKKIFKGKEYEIAFLIINTVIPAEENEKEYKVIKNGNILKLQYDTFIYITSIIENNDNAKILLGCCMRYDSIATGSQQWCIPRIIYKKLEKYSDTLGGLFECFASPLNRSSSFYYSLFPEDIESGSLGNFFQTDLSTKQGLFVANPPFTEFILNKLVDKVNNTKGIKAIIVTPSWTDALFYKKLDNKVRNDSNYSKIVFKSNNYFYEDVTKGRIQANFSSTYFLIGVDRAMMECIFKDIGYKF